MTIPVLSSLGLSAGDIGAVASNGSSWTPHASNWRDASWNAFYTDYGYIMFGPANNGWAHIYSNKTFYFNQDIYINGVQVVKNDGSLYSLAITGSAGSVPWSGITGKPASLFYDSGWSLDANTMASNSSGFTYSLNAPLTGPIVRFSAGGSYDLEMVAAYTGGNNFCFRTRNGDAGSWNAWKEVIHSGNIGSQSVNYANTAGVATYSDYLRYTSGFGIGAMNYVQTSGDFDGATGWAHYLIFNHGDGATYYHFNVRFPFWGVPQYRRQTGSTSAVTSWYDFITAENYSDYVVPKSGGTFTGAVSMSALSATTGLFSSGAGTTSSLTIGQNAAGNPGAKLTMLGYSSSYKNWQLDVGMETGNFNICPSTTDGGSTFTTPALSFDRLSAATFSSSVSMGALTATSGVFSGNVGIGTTSIYNPQSWGRVLQVSNSGSNGASLSLQDASGEWSLASYNNKLYVSNAGNTASLVINASGNVGIGTSSPASYAKLDVAGNIKLDVNGALYFYDSNKMLGADSTSLYLWTGPSKHLRFYTNDTERMRIDSSGNVGVGTTNPTSSTWGRFIQIEGTYPGLIMNSTATGGIKYSIGSDSSTFILRDETNSVTRMVINSSGYVGIGTTNPSYKLDVIGTGRFTSTLYADSGVTTTGVSSSGQITASDFYSSGNVSAYSDARLKTNVRPIETPLEKALALSPVRFNWRERSGEHIGLIAQEVRKIVPEVVSNNDGILAVDYSKLVAVLLGAIQEQQIQIDELKARLG